MSATPVTAHKRRRTASAREEKDFTEANRRLLETRDSRAQVPVGSAFIACVDLEIANYLLRSVTFPWKRTEAEVNDILSRLPEEVERSAWWRAMEKRDKIVKARGGTLKLHNSDKQPVVTTIVIPNSLTSVAPLTPATTPRSARW